LSALARHLAQSRQTRRVSRYAGQDRFKPLGRGAHHRANQTFARNEPLPPGVQCPGWSFADRATSVREKHRDRAVTCRRGPPVRAARAIWRGELEAVSCDRAAQGAGRPPGQGRACEFLRPSDGAAHV
jgi:hypothetical protein